jgi:hypothetical protein
MLMLVDVIVIVVIITNLHTIAEIDDLLGALDEDSPLKPSPAKTTTTTPTTPKTPPKTTTTTTTTTKKTPTNQYQQIPQQLSRESMLKPTGQEPEVMWERESEGERDLS